MKNLKLILVMSIFTAFVSCNPDDVQFTDKYINTTVWPLGDGIPPQIDCDPGGDNCDIGWIKNTLAEGVIQNYQWAYDFFTNRISGNSVAIPNPNNLNLNNPSIQVAIFTCYKNDSKIEEYFRNENWQVLFPKLAENIDLKYVIQSGKFDVLSVSNNYSFLIVKDKTKGYSPDNVIYAMQSDIEVPTPKN